MMSEIKSLRDTSNRDPNARCLEYGTGCKTPGSTRGFVRMPFYYCLPCLHTAGVLNADGSHLVAPVPTTGTDWFTLYLSGDKQARKQAPLARGLLQYFPNTCINVAHVSYVANEQHNPDLPLQWAFDKSQDEADCQLRHAIDAASNPVDDDQLLHLAKKAWRAFAECERYLLEKYPGAQPGASVTGFVRGGGGK